LIFKKGIVMKKIIMICAAVSTLALGACINQEQADAKMTKGCEGALNAQLGTDKVKDPRFTAATGETTADGSFRRIDMTFVEATSFDTTPRPVKCYFSEQWGAMKSSHTALLEKLDINGTVYGKQGGVVQGPLEEFLKITEAAAQAMGQ
jgi:hypothetical protein